MCGIMFKYCLIEQNLKRFTFAKYVTYNCKVSEVAGYFGTEIWSQKPNISWFEKKYINKPSLFRI